MVDSVHVVRPGFAAVDDVRRRVQQDPPATAARRRPLYRIRRTLRRGAEALTEKSRNRLPAAP